MSWIGGSAAKPVAQAARLPAGAETQSGWHHNEIDTLRSRLGSGSYMGQDASCSEGPLSTVNARQEDCYQQPSSPVKSSTSAQLARELRHRSIADTDVLRWRDHLQWCEDAISRRGLASRSHQNVNGAKRAMNVKGFLATSRRGMDDY